MKQKNSNTKISALEGKRANKLSALMVTLYTNALKGNQLLNVERSGSYFLNRFVVLAHRGIVCVILIKSQTSKNRFILVLHSSDVH